MIRYALFFLFVFLIVFDCIGDICFHRSIRVKDQRSPLYLYVGLMIYVIMGVLYYQILKNYDNLAVPNAIYQCLSVLAITFVSVVLLKESLTTQKIMGIVVIIAGLGLIQLG